MLRSATCPTVLGNKILDYLACGYGFSFNGLVGNLSCCAFPNDAKDGEAILIAGVLAGAVVYDLNGEIAGDGGFENPLIGVNNVLLVLIESSFDNVSVLVAVCIGDGNSYGESSISEHLGVVDGQLGDTAGENGRGNCAGSGNLTVEANCLVGVVRTNNLKLRVYVVSTAALNSGEVCYPTVSGGVRTGVRRVAIGLAAGENDCVKVSRAACYGSVGLYVIGILCATYGALAVSKGVLAGCGDLGAVSDNFFAICANSVAGEAGGVAGSFGSTLNNGVGVLARGLGGFAGSCLLCVEGNVVFGGVTCGVGAPVALGSVPLKVVPTAGVLYEEGAVAVCFQSPALVFAIYVKRRIGTCESDNIACERGEGVATVSINGNNKDFCIGYVCKVVCRVINALVVVGSNLNSGKELAVSGSTDQNEVAVLQLGGKSPLSCGNVGSVVGVSCATYGALAVSKGVLAGCGDLFAVSDNFLTICANSVAGEACLVAGSFDSTLNNGVGVLAFGSFVLYLRESHAGEGNVCTVGVSIASCAVNEDNEIYNCAALGVFVIGDNEGYALSCGNGNSRSAPFHIGPNVAANCGYVTNLVVANLNAALEVETNASVSCAVVGDGYGKGVVACCKVSNVGANACIGVACAVVLNVVAVNYKERFVRLPKIELQTVVRGSIGSFAFNFCGSSLVELSAAVVSSQLTGNSDGAAFYGSAGNRNIIEGDCVSTVGQIQFPSTGGIGGFLNSANNGTCHSGFVGKVSAIRELLSFGNLLSKSSGNLGRIVVGHISATSVALFVAVSVNVLGALGSIGALGNSYEPTVLNLSGAPVLTKATVNGNGVTGNGSVCHSVVTDCTGCIVSAVDGEDVAILIGNLHVTVFGVVNFGNNTGYNVLVSGVGVVLLSSTGVDSILNRGGSGDGHDPTVLDLRSALVLTNNTKDNYVVTCNGSAFHSVVTSRTVCAVGAVDGEDVAELVGDLHVTVFGVVNLGDDTCNEILAFGVGIVIHGSAEIDDILNGSCGLGELDGEGLNFGLFAAGSGEGKDSFNGFVGNGDGQLAVGNNNVFAVGFPSESNLGIYGCGKIYNCVAGEGGAELDFAKNASDLFFVALNNQLEVLEAVNAYGNEVGVVTVENENAGSVCGPTEVLSMSCIDGCLVVCLQSGGEVGNVCTNVSFLTVELELEVLGGAAKLLAGDFNALNGYEKTYIVLQAFAVSECVGDIKGFNFMNGGVYDSCRTALDLLHTGVRRYRTGNFNDHTNLDAEISNRVSVHLVGVVTALAIEVFKEEVVTGVACCLGVDSNNDTLNNNVTFGLVDVLFKGSQNVLRNGEVEGLGSGLVTTLNGSGQNVCEFFGRFFIYVYDESVFILYVDGNLVGINGPFNGVNSAEDVNLRGYFKVGGGSVLVLVEVVDVISCCVYVEHWLFVFFAGFTVANVCKVLEEIAGCKGGYAKNESQQNY